MRLLLLSATVVDTRTLAAKISDSRAEMRSLRAGASILCREAMVSVGDEVSAACLKDA